MLTADHLVQRLEELHLKPTLKGGVFSIRGQRSLITPDIAEAIKAHKAILIEIADVIEPEPAKASSAWTANSLASGKISENDLKIGTEIIDAIKAKEAAFAKSIAPAKPSLDAELASWSINEREAWGRLSNALEDLGMPLHESENLAFHSLKIIFDDIRSKFKKKEPVGA